jgi:hypothetical protein
MEMGMTSKLRNTGIGPVGYRPWGTHFCNFYATKTDLVEVLAPYFKAGLENKEFCIWVLSEPVTEPEAWNALREAIPELDEYRADGSIEIFHAREWYLKHGIFDMERVSRAWNDKLNRALDRGYEGMRVSGDTAWLERKDWSSLCYHERVLNDSVVDQKMTVLCTYPMATNGAADLLDVISTHQFAVAMRNGSWQLIETRKLKQVEAEISRIRAQVKKAEPARAEVDINQSIQGRDRQSQDAQLWKKLYRAAVLETNMELVPQRILEARKAAGERAVRLIREVSHDETELQDLVYASVVLNELNSRGQSGRH